MAQSCLDIVSIRWPNIEAALYSALPSKHEALAQSWADVEVLRYISPTLGQRLLFAGYNINIAVFELYTETGSRRDVAQYMWCLDEWLTWTV